MSGWQGRTAWPSERLHLKRELIEDARLMGDAPIVAATPLSATPLCGGRHAWLEQLVGDDTEHVGHAIQILQLDLAFPG